MTDVFISYSRKDQPVALWLAESLGNEGLDVWWDPEIVPGDKFDEKIREELTAARCVIVIWSRASVGSIWVKAEAEEALTRDSLIPVSVGNVTPPLPFNQIHTVDFTGWRGDPAHPAYQELLQAVQLRTGIGSEEEKDKLHQKVDSRRFSVVVARVQDDIGQQLQDVIAADLSEFEGIHVITIDRTIGSRGQSPEEGRRAAQVKARELLDDMGATVMIWGKILRFAGKEVPQLYLTVSRSREQRRGRYLPTDELRLPQVFWSNLTEILRLVILTYDTDFREQEGAYLGDQLKPFIAKVQKLLQRADRSRGWSDDAKGLTRINLADALMLWGSQGGENKPLNDAVGLYRESVTDLSRKRAPRDWARAQNGLGISLWILGSRHGDADILQEAVAAYHMALAEREREIEPLEWAQTWNDLGNTLTTLGQLEPGTKQLEEAVQAYETALLERTVEARPLDWAQTKNNLGVVLWYLGQREGSTERLKGAVSALNESLTVYNRKETPLDWSQSQNNLGLLFWTLGSMESSSENFRKAVKAYRAALRERSRQRVPLLWAQTQNNLGLALWSLGQCENNMKYLEQAVRVFRRALWERTPERSPMEWAQTQNNLGAVLWSLGRSKEGSEELKDAIHAYQNALSIYSRQKTAAEWAQTRHNLGNALATLGEREGDISRLKEAIDILGTVLREYDREKEPMPRAQTQGDLGYVMYVLGKRAHDTELLKEAVQAYKATRVIYKKIGIEDRANSCTLKITEIRNFIDRLESKSKT